MPLSDAKLRALKSTGKMQKQADGGGLFIAVTPNGSRLWRLAYRFEGKQKLLALGKYPLVSLSEARLARDAAKRMLHEGQDPSAVRKSERKRLQVVASNTFRSVASEWFENQKPGWVEAYAARILSRMQDDLFPRLGDRPLSDVGPIEVLEVIRSIEARGATEMARRVLQIASAIFRYGVSTSRCPRDPTADLRGALRTRNPVKHRAALKATELPDFLHALDRYDGDVGTRAALDLVLLTFVRTAEVRFALWDEFEDLDGEAPLWRIPPTRMKMRRTHLVPLSDQATKALKQLKDQAGNASHLFPAATRTGVISENTMLFALYRMGWHGRATVHGFRSTASTILNENQFNKDWIELQLAHVDGGVRGVYNAAEWLPQRRVMLQWWADFLDLERNKTSS